MKHTSGEVLTREDVLVLIEDEMKKSYGDFQIGAHMALINLRIIITELEL